MKKQADLMELQWAYLIAEAKGGNAQPLINALRDESSPIPEEQRKEIAAFIANPTSWGKKKTRIQLAQKEVPFLFFVLRRLGYKYDDAKETIMGALHLSESSVKRALSSGSKLKKKRA